MRDFQLETHKQHNVPDFKEENELRHWLNHEYPIKLLEIQRHEYLGVSLPNESRYLLELEAYKKENRLRELEGKEPLPDPKFINIL